MNEFRMPSLGADMEAGKLVEWLKQPGQQVRRGDVIAVVETQKGAIEVEIFEDGMLDRHLVGPGTTVPVGTPLAVIASAGQPAAEPATPSPAPLGLAPMPARAPVAVPPGAGRVPASPAARRLAAARGLDLAGLSGSGPGGAVVARDVEATAPPPPRAGKLDLAAMRQAIAAAMARSKREIPHYYLTATVDMAAAMGWLETANAARPPEHRLLVATLFAKAVALACRRFPELNGLYVDGALRPGQAVHVGMAISLRGGGLVAPAIHDTDVLDLDTLMTAFRELVLRVRAGTLRSSELSDPTITVSSLGERGVDGLFPIIYPPQVAIVGFGTVAARPWVVDGRVVPRPLVSVSLAGDHRVSDGHRGALFLAEIDRLLQDPEGL